MYVQVEDQAGNITNGSVTFMVGTAGLTSPHSQSSTAQYVTLAASSTSTRPFAKYQSRTGTAGTFVDIDPSSYVTIPGTQSTHPTWPQSGSVSGGTATFSSLVLDAHALLGADGIVQVRACFSAANGGAYDLCSAPSTVQVSQQTASTGAASVGPGSVNLLSGNFNLLGTDVSVQSSVGTLTVGRSLSTAVANATATTPASAVFGPDWTASFPSEGGAADQTLVDYSSLGYVALTTPDGDESDYVRSSPSAVTFTGVGDANDGSTLVANTATSPTTYTLTDTAGTVTVWTLSGSTWRISSVTQAGSASATGYSYDSSGRVTQIVGPSDVSCAAASATTTPGCRTLTLNYAAANAAQSDDPAGMQDYSGRLTSVDFTAASPVNPTTMTTVRMVRYGYDGGGNLIGQWDPRLGTPLITRYAYTGGRLSTYTPPGLKPYTFAYDGNGRLATVTRHDDALNQDAVTRLVYGLTWDTPGNASGLPNLNGATTSTWGQTSDLVASATAVFPPDHPASATPTAADWPYASLHYLDPAAREVDSASYGAGDWQIDSTQHDDSGNVIWSLTAGNRSQALRPTNATDPAATSAATTSTAAAANLLATVNTYSSDGTELMDTLGPAHPIQTGGATRDARAHTHSTYDQGAPGTGGPYHVITTSVSSSQDATSTGTEYAAITTTSGYGPTVSGDTTGWTLREPTSTSVTVTNPAGASSTLTHRTRYDSLGRVVETRLPGAATDSSGNATDARTTVTAYYTGTGTGPCFSPALSGTVCSTGPKVQPASGNPLPVKTFTYNVYGQPLTQIETAGSTVRTTAMTYDPAQRQTTRAITVSPTAAGGVAVPTVTTNYDPTTGFVTSHATSAGTDSTTYDSQGRPVTYTDASATTGGGGGGSVALDVSTSADGATTPAFSTASPNEVLVALVGSDGPGSPGAQSTTVTGGGLTWSLVSRANNNGVAEVWKATATSILTNATVTAAEAMSGFNESITVMSFTDAAGIGASQHASAGSSATTPAVSLTTTAAGSIVVAAGMDGDVNVGPTASTGQTIQHALVDTGNYNTQWAQRVTAPTATAGTTTTISDTAPASTTWDLAAAEITPTTTGGGAGSPANVSTTTYDIDGRKASLNDGKGTTTYTYDGSSTVTTGGGGGGSVALDVSTSADGATTPAFSTASPNEVLVALVGSDGPGSPGAQSTTVTGGGLTWSLVSRANNNGVAEVWKATATSILTNATVTAAEAMSGFNESITVMSFTDAAGIGASQHASAGSSATTPAVSLTTTAAGSIVVAAGMDGDVNVGPTASTGQTIQHALVDTGNYNTQWAQRVTAPTATAGTTTTISDTAPASTTWDLAAAEITPTTTGGGTTTTVAEHRGLLTSENVGVTGAASTFTAAYDAAGKMATMTYPNGLTATDAYDNTGNQTTLTYTLP